MNEVIVLELSVHRDFAHCHVDVHFVDTLIRVKNASYRNYNRDYSLVNDFYFVDTSTLDLHDH